MILLHKFISMNAGIYSAGYRLSTYQYYNSMIMSRGNFTYDIRCAVLEYYTIERSFAIGTEISPSDNANSICFDNKNFSMNLIFEKGKHYNFYAHFHIGPSRNFTFLAPDKIETYAAIYKIYYNAGKNTMKRYCNARGNYEV